MYVIYFILIEIKKTSFFYIRILYLLSRVRFEILFWFGYTRNSTDVEFEKTSFMMFSILGVFSLLWGFPHKKCPLIKPLEGLIERVVGGGGVMNSNHGLVKVLNLHCFFLGQEAFQDLSNWFVLCLAGFDHWRDFSKHSAPPPYLEMMLRDDITDDGH